MVLLALVQEVALVAHCLIQNVTSHERLLLSCTAGIRTSTRTKLAICDFLLRHGHINVVGDVNSGLSLLLALTVFTLIAESR